MHGGTIIRVLTNKGIVEIEADDLKGGELVKIIDGASGQGIESNAGNYQPQLKDGPNDLELVTAQLTLRRGRVEMVRVRRVQPPPEDMFQHEFDHPSSGWQVNPASEDGKSGYANGR